VSIVVVVLNASVLPAINRLYMHICVVYVFVANKYDESQKTLRALKDVPCPITGYGIGLELEIVKFENLDEGKKVIYSLL